MNAPFVSPSPFLSFLLFCFHASSNHTQHNPTEQTGTLRERPIATEVHRALICALFFHRGSSPSGLTSTPLQDIACSTLLALTIHLERVAKSPPQAYHLTVVGTLASSPHDSTATELILFQQHAMENKPNPKMPEQNSNPKSTEDPPNPRKSRGDRVYLINAVDGSECLETFQGILLNTVVLVSESTGEPVLKKSKTVRTYCCCICHLFSVANRQLELDCC